MKLTILDRMKPKTRYNIRLARRKGVNVRAVGIEGLDVWYELYMETALRNGLYINGKELFPFGIRLERWSVRTRRCR